jgi:hypothetical protein
MNTIEVNQNSLFDLAADFVLHTNRHVFLTGKAGTGKTTFLKYIREKSGKNSVIVAPTGVAAINAGGVTAHSFFQLPFGSFLPKRQPGFGGSSFAGTDLNGLLKNLRFNKEKRKLLEELELLIIDEVSMVRADMLDAIDGVLRHTRKNHSQPFGGIQVLYIGDLFQLPPVVNNEEWSVLSQYYKSMFFFDALVMEEARPLCIELNKIYRQSDEKFINLLNNIRNNEATEEDLRILNRYYDPYFYPDPDEGYILLTSHNYKADKVNQSALAKLNSEAYQFEGTLNGDFNENALPVDKQLTLKVGAQIMFMKNDKGEARRYYNGKIGTISRIKGDEIYVRFKDEREEFKLEKETWRNIRYKYNEGADSIDEEELGSYRQYPIKLAWAVTIHKSQGLTFEKAIIDAGQSFAAGQVYVALSRLTSLSGLVLTSQITQEAIQTDSRISIYGSSQVPITVLEEELSQSQKSYLSEKLLKCFDCSKLVYALQEHYEEFNHIKIPNQAEAIEWCLQGIKDAIKLNEVGEKFSKQLNQILLASDADGGYFLNERVSAAASYFRTEIKDKLVQPLKKHYDSTSVKQKTKKYVKTLQSLQILIEKKQAEIEQAVRICKGIADGTNIRTLLKEEKKAAAPALSASSNFQPKVKEDTKAISLRLLQEGRTLDEVAKERSLAKSTVEGHLLTYIVSGEVKLRQLVTEDNELAIRNAIKFSKEMLPGPIRSALGDTFSYNEIKAVLLQLEREAMM